MLFALLYLVFFYQSITGEFSTSLLDWHEIFGAGPLTGTTGLLLFLAFFTAFAIKVPLFPLHTWLPLAHVQAPTVGSVVLAAILLKVGTYGMMRFSLPLFSTDIIGIMFPYVIVLSLIGVIYASLVAFAQRDLKKLVAYSSIAHLAFSVIGIFSLNIIGLQGSMISQLSHGFSTGALFFIVGMISERTHTREMKDMTGLVKPMPWLAVLFMIACLSSVGLPVTSGFIGEIFVIFGIAKVSPITAATLALGMILSILYMLGMFKRVVFGVPKKEHDSLSDLEWREKTILLVLSLLIFLVGLCPFLLTDLMESTLLNLITTATGI